MREMKRNIFAIVMMAILLALGGTAQAVSYNGTYKGRSQQPTYMAPATATAPVATFQSTSAMPVMMSTANTLLNEDGTVNAEAYGVGQRPGLRKTTGTQTPNPGTEEDEEGGDDGNVPLGDGLWVLLLLAGAYILARTLRTKRAITK